MRPAISQVCTLGASFERDVEDYAAGKCDVLEIWLTKLETYLESHSLQDVQRLLAEQQMSAPVASFQGGLLTSQGERRKEAWDLFRRRLELCRQLGISTLVVVCDIAPPLEQQDVERARMSLQQAAQEAGQRGVRIALEFQARAALGNNLQTAVALVGEVASPHLGICLDVFHYHTGPSKLEDLSYLTTSNLFHVQLSDMADVPREFAADADRILPGDGEILLEPIVQRLKEIGYAGVVSLELMNPQLWQVPPLQLGEIGMTAMRKTLGLAAMQ